MHAHHLSMRQLTTHDAPRSMAKLFHPSTGHIKGHYPYSLASAQAIQQGYSLSREARTDGANIICVQIFVTKKRGQHVRACQEPARAAKRSVSVETRSASLEPQAEDRKSQATHSVMPHLLRHLLALRWRPRNKCGVTSTKDPYQIVILRPLNGNAAYV